MSNSLVSIIIPLYNAEKYVRESVASAINQTWPDKEIIIVDDGSTDRSFEVVQRFNSKFIKIIRQKNSGASAARNRGLKEAKGDYIQFLDADDLLSPEKIEIQVKELIKHPGFVALGDTLHFDTGTDPQQVKPVKEWYSNSCFEPLDFLLKLYSGDALGETYGGMIQPNSWLTPAKLIEQAGWWNEELSVDDDGEFFCRVLLASKGICHTPGAANYYRKFQSGISLSAKKDREAIGSMFKSVELKAGHLLGKSTAADVKKAISRLYWDISFLSYPAFKAISIEAEKRAVNLSPGYRTNIFEGFKLSLSKIIGWRAVRYIQYMVGRYKLRS